MQVRLIVSSLLDTYVWGSMTNERLARRSYGQYCGIAQALDLIGERWTLLVIRELLLGPLRYTELLNGLPGIATNLLARRLHDLEDAGIVERRVLPRPAGSVVYALTREGEALEPVMIGLGRFGGRFLPDRPGDAEFRPHWAMIGLKHTFRPSESAAIRRSWLVEFGADHFHVEVDDGKLVVQHGDTSDPDAIIRTTATDLLDLLGRKVSVDDALSYTLIEVQLCRGIRGKARQAKELALFVKLFGWGRNRQ
jgi:DNA-binding HxlR family transcriptional regulator